MLMLQVYAAGCLFLCSPRTTRDKLPPDDDQPKNMLGSCFWKLRHLEPKFREKQKGKLKQVLQKCAV